MLWVRRRQMTEVEGRLSVLEKRLQVATSDIDVTDPVALASRLKLVLGERDAWRDRAKSHQMRLDALEPELDRCKRELGVFRPRFPKGQVVNRTSDLVLVYPDGMSSHQGPSVKPVEHRDLLVF